MQERGQETRGRGRMSELRLRILSAIVLIAAALGSAILGGTVFAVTWGVLALIIVQEWMGVIRGKPGFWLWGLAGIAYAAGMYLAVLTLRASAEFGLLAILFLFAIVWATDIVAYFTGRAIGGPRLAPRISPKKTWSGMIGGVLGGTLAALFLLAAMGHPASPMHAGIALLLALAAVAGDLFESAFKRRFQVKDSGTLIPGHGGFMDRLDGFVTAAILAAFIGAIRSGGGDGARGLLVW
jgi:phosphatidate cytidylyltransferase